MDKIIKTKAFTLIELLVVIAMIAILSSVILYNVTQYMDKVKDATVKGNLTVLITAGEVWYDKNDNSYAGFCGSAVVVRVLSQVPSANADKYCNVKTSEGTTWAACAREFVNNQKAYCVDNKGNQKDINNSDCSNITTNCCFSGITNCIP